MDLKNQIIDSLHGAESFLLHDVALDTKEFGIKRCSSFHDVKKYPDMCLPATYNATHALILLGSYRKLEKEKKESLARFINSFQNLNGTYRFKEMKADEIWKGKSLEYSWNYIDNHVTNYCMGALGSLGVSEQYSFAFMHDKMEPDVLKEWLRQRDMSDPWLEGNNIVNLGSFLIHELEGKEDAKLHELMKIMLDWHNSLQDPNTGYWGTNLRQNPASQMEAMAGAAHNFHLYFYENKEIPYADKIIDYCLEFVGGEVKTACLDIDVVDILANMVPYGYKTEEIMEKLAQFAHKLIAFQNEDGGFADEKRNTMVRRMDGWVRGYFEPQGLSNCFATWFRCATLAMIFCVLFPEESHRFTFRNTIGIGYFRKDYLK